jgi:hypothetical protein
LSAFRTQSTAGLGWWLAPFVPSLLRSSSRITNFAYLCMTEADFFDPWTI